MGADPNDYEAVIADLEAKKAEIEATIESLRKFAGSSATAGTARVTPADIPSDAFFGMSIPDGIRKYLRMVKGKQTASTIAEGLERGGYQHTSANFGNTVRTALLRMAGKGGDVVRVGNGWGLSEWYPGRRRAAGKAKDENDGGQDEAPPPEGE